MIEIGKSLIYVGLVMLLIGIVLALSDKLPFSLGRLPGDIVYKKGDSTFYFPITTSILISIVLSVLFTFFGKYFR